MSNDFNDRYRLLKCVAVENGLRTHNAQELATGRVVMVHIADAAGPEDVAQLGMQLDALREQDRNKVLETATLASGFAVVTEFLPGFSSFPSWIAAHTVQAPRIDEQAEPRLGDLVAGRSQAPIMPELAASAVPTPAVPPPVVPPPVVPPPVVPAMQMTEPPPTQGSFTGMFGPGIAQTESPEPVVKEGPGEFTRLFAPPATAAPLPDTSKPSKLSAPGAKGLPLSSVSAPFPPPLSPPFTPSFAPPPTLPLTPPPLPPVIPFEPYPPAAPEQTPEPRLQPTPQSASQPGAAPGILPPPIFRDPVTPLSPIGGAVVQGGPKPSGPGDFTRLITQAPPPTLPVSRQPESTKAANTANAVNTLSGQRRRIPTGMILGINAVVLVAIGLILFALLRRQPPPLPVPVTPSLPTVPAVPPAGMPQGSA